MFTPELNNFILEKFKELLPQPKKTKIYDRRKLIINGCRPLKSLLNIKQSIHLCHQYLRKEMSWEMYKPKT